MTTVVNKRYEDYDVYIGRIAKGNHFGNPFTHLQKSLGSVILDSRERSIEAFGEWLNGDPKWRHVEPSRRQWILNNIANLKGKRLGCFCAPLPCHGDILAKLAEQH